MILGLVNSNSGNISSSTWKAVGYVIIGVCVFEKVVRDIQGVFLVCGLWRNALFPSSTTHSSFNTRKKYLLALGIIRRGLVNWGLCIYSLIIYLLICGTKCIFKSLISKF